jgi:hypothetical protein
MIDAFRCSFRRQLRKVIGSQKSSTPAHYVYVPTLWHYDLLSFVADSEITKGGKSNMDLVEVTHEEDMQEMNCAKVSAQKPKTTMQSHTHFI